jgi:predicted dehydrogenase
VGLEERQRRLEGRGAGSGRPLVDVGTPNNAHMEMAIEALEAGKHVACEKPLAGTLAEARQMRDVARTAKGKTFVWYNYRGCRPSRWPSS